MLGEENVGNFIKKYKYQIAIFIGIFIIKTIINLAFGTLVMTTGQDEFGTVAGASYFAGYDWSAIVQDVKYYGFGFSMFMAPIYYITSNPQVIFQLMISFNTLCLAISGIICYNIINSIYKIEDKKFNVLTTLASICFPCVLLNSNAVFNECILMLIEWVVVYLLLIMQERKDEGKSNLVPTIIFSLICVYSFTVHTRIIYVLGAVFIYIVMYLILKKKVLVNVPAFVIILGGGYVAIQKLIKIMQLKIWLTNDPEKLRNSVSNLGGYFGNVTYLTTKTGIKGFIYTIWGEVYGMFSLSGGIFAIAICVFAFIILSLIFKNKFEKVDEKLVTVAAFICSLMMAVLLLTALGVLDLVEENVLNGTANRWYLYTRYWTMCSQLAVMFVFVFFKKQKKVYKSLIISSVSLFAIVSLGFIVKMGKMFYIYQGAKSNAFSSYLGMLLMKGDEYFSTKSFVIMTSIATVILALIIIGMSTKKYSIMPIAAICLFLYVYGYSTAVLDVPASRDMYNEFKGIRSAIKECSVEDNALINYNSSGKDRFFMFGAQYNLYEYRVTREKVDVTSDKAIVISDSDKYKDKGFNLLYKSENSKYYDTVYVWAKGY